MKTLTTKFKGNTRLEGQNFFLFCDFSLNKVENNQRTYFIKSKNEKLDI